LVCRARFGNFRPGQQLLRGFVPKFT